MNKHLKQIKALIEKHDRIALFHHKLPDGDAISSSYALVLAIKKMYPQKEVVWFPHEEFLKERFPFLKFDFSKYQVESIDESWLGIIGDCSDPARTYAGDEFLKAGTKIIFDHHRNDAATKSEVFWHEPTWPAASLQSYKIAEALGVEFDEELAVWFYFGINTDTYRFAYSLAQSMPLRVTADIFEYISDERISELYKAMDQRELKIVKFQGWALKTFEIKENVAFLRITSEEQKRLNITPDEATRVNMIGNIKGVDAWIFFVQYPDFIRVEFRSLGTPVNEVAIQFDGGGHIRASGCKIQKMSETDAIIKATIEAVKQHNKN